VPDIVDRLEKKIARHVLKSMPGADEQLADQPTRVLLTEYRTWRDRFVAPVARTVKVSRELAKGPFGATYATEISILKAKIEAGDDIAPHLSERIQDPFSNRAAPNMEHRSDRDGLLSIGGRHHLHLTDRPNAKTIRRGDDVLIAAFIGDTSYFVAIVPHPTKDRGWATQDIFNSLARNWPNAGIVLQSKTAIGLTRQLNDEERRALHNAGVTTMMEVDGKVYVPGRLGQMSDGTPAAIARAVMGDMWQLTRCREDFEGTLRSVTPIPEFAYWTPDIDVRLRGFEEYFGFSTKAPSGHLFVPIGRII
jgi:hypothetical protein